MTATNSTDSDSTADSVGCGCALVSGLVLVVVITGLLGIWLI
jgi:hypothetical protein